jgi:hypothetical protein
MASDTTRIRHLSGFEQQSPASIERRLGRLIRQYVETGSPAIANSVVRHIDSLCAHPEFEGDSNERCTYLRLKTHWRWLATRAGATKED